MKPKSINLFNITFWIATAGTILSTVVYWGEITAVIEEDPTVAPFVFGGFVVGLVIAFAIPIGLWALIMFKASNVARWIYTVLTVLGAALTLIGLFDVSMVEAVSSAVLTALSIVTVILLFRPDAADWFESRGGPAANEASTFE